MSKKLVLILVVILVIALAIAWQMRTLVGLGKYKKKSDDSNNEVFNPHEIL